MLSFIPNGMVSSFVLWISFFISSGPDEQGFFVFLWATYSLSASSIASSLVV